MRYAFTTAVLATLTIGQAAAGSIHHRHAHDRRAPAPSAAPVAIPDAAAQPWSASACQQYGTWGHGPGCGDDAVATPAPIANPPPAYIKEDNVTPKDTTPEVKPKSQPKPKKEKAPTYTPSTGSQGGTSDLSAAVFNKLNAQSVVSNGMINDKSGEYSMDLVNAAGQELGFYCWPGSSGWNIGTDHPIYAATIPSGNTHTIYLGTSSSKIACAALHTDGSINQVNGVPEETQIEFTMTSSTSDSTFDVSQLNTASGHHVKMESSVCTSESNGKCSYQCKATAPCWKLEEVTLKDCLGAGTTGDNAAQNGGCSVGDGKHIKVTYN